MSYLYSIAQQGLLQQALGSGLQGIPGGFYGNQAATIGLSDATTTATYYAPHVTPYQLSQPVPAPDSNDPVAWLKKRVKEIEWRA